MHMRKRSPEEVLWSSKYQRLEKSMGNTNEYNISRFDLTNMDNITILPYTEKLTLEEPSTHILSNFDDQTISFPESCCESTKDIMNELTLTFRIWNLPISTEACSQVPQPLNPMQVIYNMSYKQAT